MSIAEVAEQSVPFALDLNGKFRNTQIRTGVLISGPSGWGEFAPFPEYNDDVSSKWLAGALEAAFGAFPAKLRNSIPVNAIIPILNVEETILAVETAIQNHGMTTFKVKVSDSNQDSLSSDASRVQAVRNTLDRLGVAGKIRIDVNGNWNLAQAISELKVLNEAARGIDYVEQPCSKISESVENSPTSRGGLPPNHEPALRESSCARPAARACRGRSDPSGCARDRDHRRCAIR